MRWGELRRIHVRCQATICQVDNTEHENQSGGKAGRSRWLGIRPTVRGSTMNPVDHPHGGGEGKTGPGGNPKTPWGKPALGYRTRKPKKASDKLIILSIFSLKGAPMNGPFFSVRNIYFLRRFFSRRRNVSLSKSLFCVSWRWAGCG